MAHAYSNLEYIVAATSRDENNSLSSLRPHILHKNIIRHEVRSFESDGPGERSLHGPRHDNDKVYIDKIRILPTADECFSLRAPWMPSKNIDSAHFMPHGYSRNIDVHFRLLRHDSIEKIRDINYNAAQRAFLASNTISGPHSEDFLETTVGNRYFIYHNLKVEDLMAGENDGVMLRMSFDCPRQLCGRQMHKSTRLMQGMLCAVLLLNHDTNELSIHYFNIEMRHSTYSMATNNGHEHRAAVELSMLPDASREDIRGVLSIAVGAQTKISMAFVEYPKLLYAGFANVLHCLQDMTDFDYAFGQYISPRPEVYEANNVELRVQPPSYSKGLEFTFDLSPLTGNPDSRFHLKDIMGENLPNTLRHLEETTTLDNGQAIALLASLSRELSFTQGPPGCGKTFLGVALTRVLLASRPEQSQKPILVVCRTNHALDSFLAGLREAGVDKLLRVGSGSKAEWTKSINLRTISQENCYSPREKSKRFAAYEKKDEAWALLDVWCRDLSKELLTGLPCWQIIYPIIRDHYPKMYTQLVTNTAKPAASSFTYDYWARGGDLATIESLHRELITRLSAHLEGHEKKELSDEFVRSCLADIAAYTKAQSSSAGEDDIWHFKLANRKRLIGDWQAQVDKQNTIPRLQSIHEEHRKLLDSVRSIRDDKYIRTMLKQNVVGMTTTACASRRDLLRAVGFEIMICEEAAEVLEAHNLCALLPSLKHAIHIGDPQQLRPGVEEQSLALENLRGRHFRLDESLFERIMKPVDCWARTIPASKLHIQRRMHPEIANVSRATYPFLQDHESTSLHLLPKGLQRRLWWLDHQFPEDAVAGVSKSVTNEHEVTLVKEFVTYLVRGNDYKFGDIAILTPYSRQLLKLREALSTEFAVWLSDEDRESLVEAGALDADTADLDDLKKRSVAIKDYIRLATIDNFQGEEAKILILSTVRSGGRLGFVKSANRINVACSRARDGFYIVGNANSLETDTKWKSIVDIFRSQQSLGQHIQLQCDRHPQHHRFAKSAHDIASFAACTIPCGQELSCGHLCVEPCHDSAIHKIISCQQACIKTLACGHKCQGKCTDACGPCAEKLPRYLSSCGHTTSAPCSVDNVECDHFEGHYHLPCGKHSVGYTCGEPAKSKICGKACGDQLSCGHDCAGVCGTCHVQETHPNCTRTCGRALVCGHQCKSSCHGNSECPQCEQLSMPACSHEDTKRKCTETPKTCLMPVLATGPDGQAHTTTCCLTTQVTISPTTLDLLSPELIASLIHPIISTFIERADALQVQISHRSQVLARTLQLFLMQQIQSTTMAANNTISFILRRTDETTTLQTKITHEQHLLSTFHNSLQALSRYYPDQLVTGLNGLLASTLTELELCAALMKARDTFVIVSFLKECNDQSRQMQRTARELAMFTKLELTRLVEKVGDDVLVKNVAEECKCLLKEVAEKEKQNVTEKEGGTMKDGFGSTPL